MRTLVLALGVVLVFSVSLPCRADFDSGGGATLLKSNPEIQNVDKAMSNRQKITKEIMAIDEFVGVRAGAAVGVCRVVVVWPVVKKQ
jgi:hypothetical protein